jgi:hypothetical protein
MSPADVHWSAIGAFWASIAAAIIAVSATVINYLFFRSQLDPHVIVYATTDERRPSIVVLVIENIGKSMAKNVTFEFSRSFPKKAFGIAETESSQPEEMDEGPLITGIPSLGPGSKRVITWGQFGGLHKALGDKPVDVTVHFDRDSSVPFSCKKLSVVCPVDIKSFEHNDASDHNWDKKAANELERIAKALEKMAKN